MHPTTKPGDTKTTTTTKKSVTTTTEKEEEVKWLYTQKHVLPVSSFRENIYRSKKQMDRAVQNNKFHINNTMAMKNGRLYFLCYE